jgi:hypothetical protein
MVGMQPPQRVPAPQAAPTSSTVRAPRSIALTILRSLTTSQWQINATPASERVIGAVPEHGAVKRP